MPAVILTAIGLLSKFNIGIACLASFLTYLALGLFCIAPRQAVLRGAALIVLHMAVLALLFVSVNGPITFLDDYFMTSWSLASGYSSQMTLTIDSDYESFLLVLACGVSVSLLTPLLDRRTRCGYAHLLMILALPLFLTYKSAIVRFDGHHTNAGVVTFIALLCLLLPAEMSTQGTVLFRRLIPALTLGAVITVVAGTQDSLTLLRTFPLDGPRHLAELFVWDRVPATLHTAFEAFREHETLSANDRSYIKDASVDVYPWDISLVTANQLQWNPRYVFQSYAAFQPAFDAMGAEHYNGPRAPRFILYRHQSIDNQHPCLVDPRTWLAIYRWYDLKKVVPKKNGLLLLERRAAPRFGEPSPIGSRTIEIGQEIWLPGAGDRLLLLEVELNLTLLGRLKEQLYKVEPPNVRIKYEDGETVDCRLVWKNLASGSGAMVSELPRNLEAAAGAFSGKRFDQVQSVTLLASHHWFRKRITIQFSAIDSGKADKEERPKIKL